MLDDLAEENADDAIEGCIVGFLRIASQMAPRVASKVVLLSDPNYWRWGDLERKARMVLGAVREAERIDAMLGPQGPVVAVAGCTRSSCSAARLSDHGHYRDAVPQAAGNVDELAATLPRGRRPLSGRGR